MIVARSELVLPSRFNSTIIIYNPQSAEDVDGNFAVDDSLPVGDSSSDDSDGEIASTVTLQYHHWWSNFKTFMLAVFGLFSFRL